MGVGSRGRKWRLLLPGASEPRLTAAKTARACRLGQSSCVTQPEQPEHSCRWQLWNWPDNGGTMPSKSLLFTPSSILFRPRRYRPVVGIQAALVEAPGTATGSDGFITTDVYRHRRVAPAPRNIGPK